MYDSVSDNSSWYICSNVSRATMVNTPSLSLGSAARHCSSSHLAANLAKHGMLEKPVVMMRTLAARQCLKTQLWMELQNPLPHASKPTSSSISNKLKPASQPAAAASWSQHVAHYKFTPNTSGILKSFVALKCCKLQIHTNTNGILKSRTHPKHRLWGIHAQPKLQFNGIALSKSHNCILEM